MPRRNLGQPIKQYFYLDEESRLLHVTERYEPKTFRQWRPDGDGGRIWNLDGARRVLYRLPYLKNRKEVVVVEGEKDVDRLEGMGIAATCNPMGAGKWRPEYAEQLKQQLRDEPGRRVAIIPDHDKAGRKHAQEVLSSCLEAGLQASILELSGLPEHGDVSDWLNLGHSKEDLLHLLEHASTVCRLHAFNYCSWPVHATKAGRLYRLCREHLTAFEDQNHVVTREPSPSRQISLSAEDDERRKQQDAGAKAEWFALRDQAQSNAVEEVLGDLKGGKFTTVVELLERIQEDPWLRGARHPHRHRLVEPVIEFVISKTTDQVQLDACQSSMSTIFPEVQRSTIRDRFKEARVARLKAQAEERGRKKTEADQQALAKLRAEAAPVLDTCDPLEEVAQEAERLGWGGDPNIPKMIYAAHTSRVLDQPRGSIPFHLQINASPGSGKSYGLEVTLSMFPKDTYEEYDATSPKVLIHDEASFKHKAVIFTEADSIPGVADKSSENDVVASILRTLLQRGEATYKTVVKDKETNQQRVVKVKKEGPTVLITTSVENVKGEQLDSRFGRLAVPETRDQQRAALNAQCDLEELDQLLEVSPAFLAFQDLLQAMAPIKVVIPFSRQLSMALADKRGDPKLLRDASRIKTLVKTVTAIRHAKREVDAKGRLVAAWADYETAAELLEESYSPAVNEATMKIRQVVEQVDFLTTTSSKPVSINRVAQRLGLAQSVARRLVAKALRQGWLVNFDSKSERQVPLTQGMSANLKVGEDLPETLTLPTVEEVRATPVAPMQRAYKHR